MGKTRSWVAYPATYRAGEVRILLDWIRAGVSGALIGGPGSGKSNLLGFLCHRPDLLDAEAAIFLIPLDLNNLPANDLSTLYRTILRAFYEARGRYDDTLRDAIGSLFHDYHRALDPFVAQTAVREWLLRLQQEGKRIVFVIDRFDWFCEHASPEMADTLRGLRDSFKDTLSFIVGSRRELLYYADRDALGELYELLDTFACWIQPMAESHARQLVAQETGAREPPEEALRRLLALSGHYPSLLKTACHWWLSQERLPPAGEWLGSLRRFPAMAHRLEALWQSFSAVEQQTLQSLVSSGSATPAAAPPADVRRRALTDLEEQGIIHDAGGAWQIRSELLAVYAGAQASPSRGGLWLQDATETVYQGESPVDDLSPLEGMLLRHLLEHPYVRHTHTELIEAAWPEDTLRAGVSTEALYQVVRGLRRKIEPQPSRPRYLVNWRGTPEGGYRCFPEGRPG